MITCGTPTGWLECDSIPLHCAAWTLPDLLDLWMGGDRRGEDRLIPGLAGLIANKRWPTSTNLELDMIICGDVDRFGQRYTNPWDGLLHNIDYLRANVADPFFGNDTGQRTFTLHLPGGTTRTALATVENLTRGEAAEGTTQDGATGVLMRASLEITIQKPGVFV